MNPVAADALCYTPAELRFEPDVHRYTLSGRPLLSVTGVLRAADLQDHTWATEEARSRGVRVHAEIAGWLRCGARGFGALEAGDEPFVAAFQRFMAECPLRVDAVEEMVCDPALHCAGTLDLRGQFLDLEATTAALRYDLIDIKTGATPCWVGYQTAGYARLLPPAVAARCRRWALTLTGDGTYRLEALVKRSDDVVFMAALVIAQAKRGWLA